MADVIRKPAKYIAELFAEIDYKPNLSTAPNVFGREYNIYHFSVAKLITDSSNYWIQWGGTFDNPVGFGLQVFFDSFLAEVFTESSLLGTENSFYIDKTENICYVNIPKKPWQYKSSFTAVYYNDGTTYSSAPKDETNLSDISYGGVKAIPIMSTPTLENSLNEVLSGIIVYNEFLIELSNHDGSLDGLDIIQYYNTPLQISKTTNDAQNIEDFNRIRFGIVSNIEVDFNFGQIKAVEQVYRFDTSYCRKFSDDDYPNIDSGNINKDIPVGWGPLRRVELFQVDKDSSDPATWIDYIALDPEYINDCTTLYDSDGNSLTFTYDSGTGIIRATEVDGGGEVIEAESADVDGRDNNLLGEIIIDAIAEGEGIEYTDGIWDISETDSYILISPSLQYYFAGGTTRDLLEGALKNDLAFLIQKNSGLLTLRRWGEEYNTHQIASWITTQDPSKDFEDATKYYCSSVEIRYDLNQLDDNYSNIYTNTDREDEISEEFRRSYNAIFELDLVDYEDIEDLSSRILDRFGSVRETLTVGVGVDTFNIDLLDTVRYEGTINDREFSQYSTWIVKKADPGQDILVMEGLEITYLLTFDDVDATLDNDLFEVS